MERTHAVIDDFLSPREHLDLWAAYRESVAASGTRGEWNRTYQLMDGEDFVSSAFQPRRPVLRDGTPNTVPGPPPLGVFGQKLSAVLTADRPPLAIAPWTGFSVSAWVYRPGAGLGWHGDTGRIAAYIYYMHPQWRSSWGGELLVGAGDGSASDSPDVEAVCTTGGVFIYPRPNRLVLLRGGTLHCVKKVESAAGDASRTSVSGFFFNTGGVGASG